MNTEILIEQIKSIASANGVSPNKAFIESGVGKDFFYNIRKGKTPSINKIQKLASYFDVTTDYLLGNEQKNKPSSEEESLSPEAVKLAKKIDRLSPANHAKLDELVDLYLSAQGKKK